MICCPSLPERRGLMTVYVSASACVHLYSTKASIHPSITWLGKPERRTDLTHMDGLDGFKGGFAGEGTENGWG